MTLKQPSKKKSTPRLKNRPRLPRAKNKPARKRRSNTIARHIEKLYGTVYCPALRANVAFNRKTSKRESVVHSSGDRDSTLFALNIELLLQTATIADRLDPKPGNKQQAPFCKMIILEQKIKGHGTARIVVGKYKPDYQPRISNYCHYCVTRWNIKKGPVKRRGD